MLYSLGKIITDDRVNAFHNDKHIYPVGFKSGRSYGSVQDPAYIIIIIIYSSFSLFLFLIKFYKFIVKKLNIYVK